MTVKVSHTAEVQNLFKEAAGLNNDQGSPRVKQIMLRLINDAARIIEDLTPVENEIVLPKTSSGVFNSTNIDYVLRNLAQAA